MTPDTELIQLFDRYHLKQASPEEKAKVETLIREDASLKEVFDFRRSFISAVRQNEREDLLQTFRTIEAEMAEETNVISLSNWRLAAAAALVILIGFAVFWNYRQSTDTPQIVENQDTLKTQPLPDTVRNVPIPQPQVAQKDPVKTLQGAVTLPYYESSGSLGFSKDDRPSDYAQVVFYAAKQAEYEYSDTLKIYLPQPLRADRYWKIVYESEKDLYHLTDGKTDYPLVRDQGRKPLVKR